jgi:hypothetical protein
VAHCRGTLVCPWRQESPLRRLIPTQRYVTKDFGWLSSDYRAREALARPGQARKGGLQPAELVTWDVAVGAVVRGSQMVDSAPSATTTAPVRMAARRPEL